MCAKLLLGPYARKRRNKERINNPKNIGHIHYATTKGSAYTFLGLLSNFSSSNTAIVGGWGG